MAITGSVTITGNPIQGQTLTATNDITDSDGITSIITYLWKADNVAIGTASASNTLVLGPLQAGKKISVTALYYTTVATVALGTPVQIDSIQTDYIDTLPTGGVTIAGTATQGNLLTASNNIADADGIKSLITYQWKQNGSTIDGATNSTLTLDQSNVGKAISVTASYTDILNRVNSVTSTATTLVANVNDTPTGAVTIVGEVIQGKTLTVTNSIADLDGLGTITYQWKASGTNISGATTSTLILTQAQVGKVITVSASYTDSYKFAESVSSGATAVVANVNDPPTGTVTISGTPTQGKVLTVSTTIADLDGLGTISYQWKADGNDIVGATAKTLTLGQGEVGKIITVTASYTDLLGSVESVTSTATTVVTNVNDIPIGSVTITGFATQGQTLNASNNIVDTDGIAGAIAYQWKANGVNIIGATSNELTLTQTHVGQVITVAASYTDAFGTLESVTSIATNKVTNINDVPTGEVTISGDAMIGKVLSATNTLDDLDGLGVISYQWKANGNNINGATSNTLILTQAQVGKAISVTATYTDFFNHLEAVSSANTGRVTTINTPPTGNVSITGIATQGNTLSASNTVNDIDGLGTISYQWKADGINIPDAISSAFILSQDQVGKVITVVASYIDNLGKEEFVLSNGTSPVSNINDPPTGRVDISGNPKQGETLRVTSTVADIDGLGDISYQWIANGIPIANAITNTLTLSPSLIGKVITVTANYIDGWGEHESVTSMPTTVVTAQPSAPVISGIPGVTQRLTAGEPITLNNLVVSDTNADSTNLVLTLYAQNGAFSILSNPGSLMPALQLTGSVTEINTTLKYLNFTSLSDGLASFQAQLVNPFFNLSTLISVQFNSATNSVPGITRSGGLPIAGDGNGDGIVDTTQSAVSSVVVSKSPNPDSTVSTDTTFVTLVADSIAGKVGHPLLAQANIHGFVQADIPMEVPPTLIAPLGTFSFTAIVNASEKVTPFSFYLDNDLGINGYWMQSASGYWTNLALPVNGGGTTTEGGKLRLDFQIEDGGIFDSDGLANGIIVNTGVAGSLPLSLVGQTPANVTFGF